METTYTIIGQDGGKYGPANLATLRSWIAEGRLSSSTQVQRSDSPNWLPASQYPELGIGAPAPVVLPGTPPPPMSGRIYSNDDLRTFGRIKVGANWFYWIVGLSVVNAILSATRAPIVLAFGLGFPRFFPDNMLVLAGSAVFAVFGYFGGKGQLWAFIVGMILYALDGIVLVLANDWLSLVFHGYVLYRLFMGAKGCFDLKSRSAN